jgi:hypothetical protein
LSVRANVTGQDAFTPPGYVHGVRRCDEAAGVYGVKVILLAFSSDYGLNEEGVAEMTDAVLAARTHGMSVVGAAGNTSGGPVGTPANVSGVLSVGATDSASGSLCAFSASGAQLLAPGCTLDAADPASGAPTTSYQGTSAAAAVTAAALAALRTWRPDLTPDEADRLLNETATRSEWGRRLDLAAAFTAAGLGAIAQPPATPAPPTPPPAPQAVKTRLPKPKLKLRSRGRGATRSLVARATNRPRGTKLTIRVYVRGRGGKLRRVASGTRTSSIVTVRVRSWKRVTATFTDPSGQRLRSPTAIVQRPL